MKLSKDKKGVELTFNTIVIIVLVLLVLLIVGYILIKGFGTAQNSMSCEANGGSCAAGDRSTSGLGCKAGMYLKPWQCSDGKACCTSDLLK